VALLVEAVLFFAAGSEGFRSFAGAMSPRRLAMLLSSTTAATWLLAGNGQILQGIVAVGTGLLLAYWYVLLPRTAVSDMALLALYGAVALGKLSAWCYEPFWLRAPNFLIGELAWLRTMLIVVLVFRRPDGMGFGFLPSKREWIVGVKWFALFAPCLILFTRTKPLPDDIGKLALAVAGTFLGHYVFVALREEFLFRGLLLPRLQGWLGARLGLMVTCLVFGLVHLPMGQFPNWTFVAAATLAGWFYAKAYMEGQGIRAAMVTHALTNVIVRVFVAT